MAIALRGSPIGNAGSGLSIVVNVPTGVVDGDLLICSITGYQSPGASPGIPQAPVGWTPIPSISNPTTQSGGTSGDSISTAVWYRIASSEPASYTFTISNAGLSFTDASIIAYSGVDTLNPFNLTAAVNKGDSTTPSWADLDATTVDQCWHVLGLWSLDFPATPSGFTQDIVYDSNRSLWFHKILANGGFTGGISTTQGGSEVWIAPAIVLQPTVIPAEPAQAFIPPIRKSGSF